ncbi:hypothetical protein M5X00_24080 [Paenibacillus alvei]|uniref:Uncharacterized protein n=1 Tax=Paenibacillus alvei TaxID=44250 RepID=A0ABT4GR40_PAEAL|nr:hypothetical protein [Paenibacillus alvei]MCY9543598.1 hypothetical protein [Paenibacillus alvei]MCY9737332.1 hypothetical protein [Paenibacillus alvei]MCY9757308.1 hypothetical protein [Paenibacillus alvei]MCY9759161.1 hypothetical protein [Paenibacillus alvei]MCY9770380.1 hypothetical protein [Paenibacillus alvei]
MPTPETRWYCDKCHQPYETEGQATECENSHYDVVKVVGVSYSHRKKCPQRIQLQIMVGDDIKEVFYDVVEDGWGKN